MGCSAAERTTTDASHLTIARTNGSHGFFKKVRICTDASGWCVRTPLAIPGAAAGGGRRCVKLNHLPLPPPKLFSNVIIARCTAYCCQLEWPPHDSSWIWSTGPEKPIPGCERRESRNGVITRLRDQETSNYFLAWRCETAHRHT
jgi:hypothetical protein